jgi:hypothetical protein
MFSTVWRDSPLDPIWNQLNLIHLLKDSPLNSSSNKLNLIDSIKVFAPGSYLEPVEPNLHCEEFATGPISGQFNLIHILIPYFFKISF